QQFVPDVSFSFDWTSLIEKMNVQRIYLSVFMRHIPNTQPANIVNMSTRTMQEFHGQMPLFKSELDRWKKLDYSVLILTVNNKRAEKVQAILRDYDMEVAIQDEIYMHVAEPMIAVGEISKGIEIQIHK